MRMEYWRQKNRKTVSDGMETVKAYTSRWQAKSQQTMWLHCYSCRKNVGGLRVEGMWQVTVRKVAYSNAERDRLQVQCKVSHFAKEFRVTCMWTEK